MPLPQKPEPNIPLYALWLGGAVTFALGLFVDSAWTPVGVVLAGLALAVSAIRHQDYLD